MCPMIDRNERLRTLHSQLAVDLSESDNSPIWGRVTTEWESGAANRPITLPQLAGAIADSQLTGTVKSGVLHPGFLFHRDWETTHVRTSEIIEKYLTLFMEGAPEHWAKDRRTGGFLCTNLGIAALLRLLKTLLEYKSEGQDNIEYGRLSSDAVVGTVTDMIYPVVDWFNNAKDSDMERFRGRYGSGAPIRHAYALMEIIHEKNPRFSPQGLTEYIQGYSIQTISRAQQLITEIEDTVRDMTISILKTSYGEEHDSWWRGGVPQVVRGNAAQRAETSEEGGMAHQYLDLLDYKKIAELPKNWRSFERAFTIEKGTRSKKSRLAWMDRLNTIRNRVSHSGRRHVTADEIEFLEDAWIRIDEHRGHIEDHPASEPSQGSGQ